MPRKSPANAPTFQAPEPAPEPAPAPRRSSLVMTTEDNPPPPSDATPAPEAEGRPPVPSWSNNPDPSPSLPGSDSDSGTRSTPAKPLGKAQLRKLGENLVGTVTTAVAGLLTRPGSLEHQHGLWVADEKDREVIGGALAGMGARRVPAGVAGEDTPDVVALVVGLVGYVAKNVMLRARIQRLAGEDAYLQGEVNADQLGDGEAQS